MLRFLTAGESHGKALNAIIEGLPAGLKLKWQRINDFLGRRQAGYGRGTRMQLERDQLEIISGVRNSVTLGTPVSLLIKNQDAENWQDVLAVKKADLSKKRLLKPRPGHADFAGGIKYRHRDLRNVLERASARETAVRTAVGAIAFELLAELGFKIQGQVMSIGSIQANPPEKIVPSDMLRENPLFCTDQEAVEVMLEEIKLAEKAGDSLGGTFQVLAENVPPGLGSHVHWDRRLDGRLAQALMSIPGIKSVEIGLGRASADLPGSQVHDSLFYQPKKGYYRLSNNAGGLEGGITNGERLVVRAAMKPIPTLRKPLETIHWETKKPVGASVERSDVCAVPAAMVVAEAMVAWVLAEAVLEKFAGDHLDELKTNFKNYCAEI